MVQVGHPDGTDFDGYQLLYTYCGVHVYIYSGYCIIMCTMFGGLVKRMSLWHKDVFHDAGEMDPGHHLGAIHLQCCAPRIFFHEVVDDRYQAKTHVRVRVWNGG